jgi:hypothetical protein
VAGVGQIQAGVDPRLLLPSRSNLTRARLDFQRQLLLSGQARHSRIDVTAEGVIWDGHHGARAAADLGLLVEVRVVRLLVPSSNLTLLQLPVR